MYNNNNTRWRQDYLYICNIYIDDRVSVYSSVVTAKITSFYTYILLCIMFCQWSFDVLVKSFVSVRKSMHTYNNNINLIYAEIKKNKIIGKFVLIRFIYLRDQNDYKFFLWYLYTITTSHDFREDNSCKVHSQIMEIQRLFICNSRFFAAVTLATVDGLNSSLCSQKSAPFCF